MALIAQDLVQQVMDTYKANKDRPQQMQSTYLALTDAVDALEQCGLRKDALAVLDGVLSRIAILFPSELRARAFLRIAQLTPELRLAANYFERSIAIQPLPEAYLGLAGVYRDLHDNTHANRYEVRARAAEAAWSKICGEPQQV